MNNPKIISNDQEGFMKGDIIDGRKTNHPIIYIERVDDDQFIGCVLTHSPNRDYPDNIGLKTEHFCAKDETGKEYKRQFDASYFISLKFIKKNDWGPFTQTGKLTVKGVVYIIEYIKNKKPTYWDTYISE